MMWLYGKDHYELKSHESQDRQGVGELEFLKKQTLERSTKKGLLDKVLFKPKFGRKSYFQLKTQKGLLFAPHIKTH